MTQLALIAALARNNAIGLRGRMPWHLPADLQRFKRLTMGHPIIMGRKTFESIGRVLPGRMNIVISRANLHAHAGCTYASTLDAALEACARSPLAFVIGGAEIYRLAFARAERMYLTRIEAEFAGDTFFPAFEPHHWRETARTVHHHAGPPAFDYAFADYERIPA